MVQQDVLLENTLHVCMRKLKKKLLSQIQKVFSITCSFKATNGCICLC